MSCKHGNHESACDICDEVSAAYESGLAARLAAPAVANAAAGELPKFDTSPLADDFWELVADCGGTKDLGKNARLLQEWVKNYARAAIAALPKPVVAMTDDTIYNFWLYRDCMPAIQAGDMRGQFISAARDILAAAAPNALLVEALQLGLDSASDLLSDAPRSRIMDISGRIDKIRAALAAHAGQGAKT